MTTATLPRIATTEQGRGALVALYFATVAVFADMYIAQPILPLLSHEYNIAPATAGLSVSAVVISIALASSLYGPVSDALGRKPVMVVTALVLALPTLRVCPRAVISLCCCCSGQCRACSSPASRQWRWHTSVTLSRGRNWARRSGATSRRAWRAASSGAW